MPDRGDRRTARGGDHGHDHAHHRVALPVLSLRGARRHRIAGQLLLPSLRLAASAARPVVCRPCSLDVLLPGGSGRRQTPACRGERHDPWSRSCERRHRRVQRGWPAGRVRPRLRAAHRLFAQCTAVPRSRGAKASRSTRLATGSSLSASIPRRARDCARAAREAVKRLGIDIRAAYTLANARCKGAR